MFQAVRSCANGCFATKLCSNGGVCASAGDIATIDRWSLKFCDTRAEEAFVRTKQHLLSRSVYRTSIFVVALSLALAMIILSATHNRTNQLLWSFEQKKLAILAFIVILAFLVSLVFKMLPLSALARELLIVGVGILGATAAVCIDSWYLYKLHGVEPTQENLPRGTAWSDSKVLLVLDIVITLTHLFTPVRWFTMVPLEISVVLLYGAMMLLGGPEEATAYFNLVMLSALVAIAALGKRTIEYLERLSFLNLLQEKKLRFQTEFKLEMIRSVKVSREVDSISDTTAKIFDPRESTPSDLESKLQEIAEIGRSEQWLIDKAELRILNDCLLGVGGFGIVVGGLFCEKPVAVKIAKRLDTYAPWRNIVDISNEVRVLRRVRHPNIVLFHGAYVDTQQCDLALVVEKIVGGLLSEYVSSTSMNKKRFEQLCFGLCHALIYLHSRKPAIVHGDLKPQNIVVERSDLGLCPKLLDFGLSRILSSGIKPAGRTVAWASPEILLNPHDNAQTSADVFSFGCILYFILTGLTPREGQNRRQIMASARSGRVILLRWPCDQPFIEECRPPVTECVEPKCDERPSIKHVFEQFSLVGSQRRRSASPGEHPTSEVLHAIRQACRQRELGNILDISDPCRNNECVSLHHKVFGEDAWEKKQELSSQDSLHNSIQWLDAIVVDCDICDPAWPVRKCSVCYSSLSSIPDSLDLKLPALLSQWFKPDCHDVLRCAVASFMKKKLDGVTPYPCDVHKLTLTSVLQSKDADNSEYAFVGCANICDVVEDDSAPSSSNTEGGEIKWSARIMLSDFQSLCTNSSSTKWRRESDLAPIPEGRSTIEL